MPYLQVVCLATENRESDTFHWTSENHLVEFYKQSLENVHSWG